MIRVTDEGWSWALALFFTPNNYRLQHINLVDLVTRLHKECVARMTCLYIRTMVQFHVLVSHPVPGMTRLGVIRLVTLHPTCTLVYHKVYLVL